MKVKAYLNRLLREESSSMWGVRLIIKIILVLLVLGFSRVGTPGGGEPNAVGALVW